MSKIPTGAWWFFSIVAIGLFATLAVLGVTGTPTDDFWRFVNLAFNSAGVLLGGGGMAYAAKAKQAAEQAAEQTQNGHLTTAVTAALTTQRVTDKRPGGVFGGQ